MLKLALFFQLISLFLCCQPSTHVFKCCFLNELFFGKFCKKVSENDVWATFFLYLDVALPVNVTVKNRNYCEDSRKTSFVIWEKQDDFHVRCNNSLFYPKTGRFLSDYCIDFDVLSNELRGWACDFENNDIVGNYLRILGKSYFFFF